jgi:nitrite reductase/ring-hydroxylating ferredoxin subunit
MKPWNQEKHAPAPGQFLCPVEGFADGDIRELTLGMGSKHPFQLFIHRQGGEFRCFVNRCPHFGIPLNLEPGRLLSSDRLQFMCSTHYARFNFDDGLCTEGPCEGDSLERIPLETRDSALYVASSSVEGA